jgi:phage terminase small subunit
MTDLTPKQAAFVQEYLIDLNASAAYRRAGYSGGDADVNGPALMGNHGIKAAIDAEMAKRSNRVRIDQDEVIAGLRREAERTGEGSSHSARVQALIALGRHLGMFNDKLAVTAEVVMSPAERRARIDELLARRDAAPPSQPVAPPLKPQ